MKGILRQSIILTSIFVILCGLIYPLAVTGLGQLIFNKQANGNIITYNGRKVGSELLGQNFTDTRFFHGRISGINYNTYTKADTTPDSNGKTTYNGVTSGSQNLGPSNKALEDRIKNDIDTFLKTHPGVTKAQIPADFLTSSGSGLDPDISLETAAIQIPLISQTTGISTGKLQSIINNCASGRSLGIFGEPRVNVLKINLKIAKELDLK